jgi:hypothetical protein
MRAAAASARARAAGDAAASVASSCSGVLWGALSTTGPLGAVSGAAAAMAVERGSTRDPQRKEPGTPWFCSGKHPRIAWWVALVSSRPLPSVGGRQNAWRTHERGLRRGVCPRPPITRTTLFDLCVRAVTRCLHRTSTGERTVAARAHHPPLPCRAGTAPCPWTQGTRPGCSPAGKHAPRGRCAHVPLPWNTSEVAPACWRRQPRARSFFPPHQRPATRRPLTRVIPSCLCVATGPRVPPTPRPRPRAPCAARWCCS